MRRRLQRSTSSPTWGRWAITATAARSAAWPPRHRASRHSRHGIAGWRDGSLPWRATATCSPRFARTCCSARTSGPPRSWLPCLPPGKLGIPTATFIFSWDNLTSKGRIAAPFDDYLVWSDCMAEELLRYYPDVTRRQVHVVGTPQFDPYDDDDLRLSRDDYFRQIGADPARPLICFSGGDAGNCPDDPHHVRLLLELIRSGPDQGRSPGDPAPVSGGPWQPVRPGASRVSRRASVRAAGLAAHQGGRLGGGDTARLRRHLPGQSDLS